MKRSELNKLIYETVYEMIIEHDENLIHLMRESERANGPIEEDINEWIEKTVSALNEALGIEEEAVEVISEERQKMLRLADI